MNYISRSAKLYRNTRIIDSSIADYAIVADDCDLVNVKMYEHSEFGRRNIIRNVEIGYGSYTGQNTTIKDSIIGKFSCLSSDVNIYGNSLHSYNKVSVYTDYWINKTFNQNFIDETETTKTIIGNDVWIGTNVVILDSIKIGDGAIIGAGSVVTKDIPAYSIAVGNPAKVVKMRFPENLISDLLKIEWWNLSPDILKQNIDLLRKNVDYKVIKQLRMLKMLHKG